MSTRNAIVQRQESIAEYQRILETETDQKRIDDIQNKIKICEEEIALLNENKPLFGKPKPLQQETRIYEPNPEKKGEQKITVINPKTEPETKPKKIGNALRDTLKSKIGTNEANELKMKVQEIKKTRAKFN